VELHSRRSIVFVAKLLKGVKHPNEVKGSGIPAIGARNEKFHERGKGARPVAQRLGRRCEEQKLGGAASLIEEAAR
jgi:hypothetical protein